MCLWICQSAVKNRLYSKPLLLSIHLVSWAWMKPVFVQKTPPQLLSLTTSLSFTPPVRKGTGLPISNNWKYSTQSSLCNSNYLECHAITVTLPVKLHIVVIYIIPGQLVTFIEELDGLLSSFSGDWQSICSLWWLQYPSGEALHCRLPLPSFHS